MIPSRVITTLALFLVCSTLPGQAEGFTTAAAYSKERGGLAVLVYRGGQRVFEDYHNGHAAETPQHIFSGTKSFAPMVALVAQKEGLLSLDEKVAGTITEWKGDTRREKITIRQLLHFTSGLRNNDRALHSGGTPDCYAASIACPCIAEPGSKFRYGSNHLMVFGELLKRKLAAAAKTNEKLPKDFLAYLKARILEPIGCEVATWIRDEADNPMLPYGAFMTAREWAKFGLLVMNRGRWKKRQIIPTEHFDECFRGSEANRWYGLNFWLIGHGVHRKNEAIPADTVAAVGMYNQKLYILPSKKTVVVRLGKTGRRGGFDDARFLGRVMEGLTAEAPAPAGR